MDPRETRRTQESAGTGRPAEAGRTVPAQRAQTAPEAGPSPTRYSADQKLAILRAYAASPEGMRDFCARHQLTTTTLCAWRKRFDEEGEAGLQPRPNPRNARGKRRGPFTPEQRREAVETFATSGLQMDDFCRVWGVGRSSLSKWLKRYREEGPKGLENRQRRNSRPHPCTTPEAVQEAVRETKRRHPTFGLRKVRDWLLRFGGTKVSTTTVKKVLVAADLHDRPKPVKKRRKKPQVRRFEVALPRELWQSDITSFVLPRSGRRLYLTVFLDDHSRYIVGWQLATHQRAEQVIEALLEGIARFGKPKEVLTDQGRQYFAWRGKSRFQKLLHKEGIGHVVSRAHHPQTLGKTERFWATVNSELWERVRITDLVEAKVRMEHFISHYNHFRPHQGIAGAVPADRFFAAEDAMRATVEKRLGDELERALAEPKREAVYLFGRVGEQSVSLHGESGRLVVQTEDGRKTELDMSALGGAGTDGKKEETRRETDAVSGAGADADRRAGAVESGDGGGADAGAPSGDGGARVLAGEEDEGGCGGGTGGDAAASVATIADGGVGYGGGPFEATAWPWSDAEVAGRGSGGAEEADLGTGKGGGGDGATGADREGSSAVTGGGERGEKGGQRRYDARSEEVCGSWDDFREEE